MSAWRRQGGRVVAALLAALMCACGPGGEPRTGPPAPDFVLERVGGGELALADLRGKLVLLDFWATWCAPCVKEIPELNAIRATYRERGVEVVGLAVDDLEADALGSWLKEKGVEYPVARAGSDLAAAYGAYQFPTHVIVSPQGILLEKLEPGYHSRDELEAALEAHLDAAASS